jgi:linoleoyl-CoA desaturase
VAKTVSLLSAYILPFIALLFIPMPNWLFFALWLLMGFAIAGIGMGVMHDANHGSYSKSGKANFWLGHTLNLLGASVFNWKLQHNMMHHTYTNVIELDHDIEDKVILRFSPHTEVKWFHRFQFIYAFFLYGILTLNWTFYKDFDQFRAYIKQGVNRAGLCVHFPCGPYMAPGNARRFLDPRLCDYAFLCRPHSFGCVSAGSYR